MPGVPISAPVTRGTLRDQLRQRLNSAQFWTDAELNSYLQEALYVWQAYARYWRSHGTFSTRPFVQVYDLADEIPGLSYTLTDSAVLSYMELHLLEPQGGIPSTPTWFGSEMFAQAAFTQAIENRRNSFLLESGSALKFYFGVSTDAGSPFKTFPASVMAIRRLSYLGRVLWRDDEFAANAYSPGWTTTPGDVFPLAYSVSVTPPFTVQFLPAPSGAGTVELLAIVQGPPLNPVAGVILGIPDNFAWAIKFGALADLLSQDGAGRDEERARYCEQRYQEGVQLARRMPAVINGTINGVVAEFDSMFNWDAYSIPSIQQLPKVLVLAGQNILLTDKTPDDVYSIGLDIVGTAPLMRDDTTPIPLSADIADVIVDESQHLALFKEGGAEFAGSTALHQNFLRYAAVYRARSLAETAYWPDMMDLDQLEFTQRMLVLQ